MPTQRKNRPIFMAKIDIACCLRGPMYSTDMEILDCNPVLSHRYGGPSHSELKGNEVCIICIYTYTVFSLSILICM